MVNTSSFGGSLEATTISLTEASGTSMTCSSTYKEKKKTIGDLSPYFGNDKFDLINV